MTVIEELTGKKVVFITTKNLDYIRNSQEIKLLNRSAKKCDVIGFYDKSYVKRILKIYLKMLTFKQNYYDIVFCGFAPQLIVPVWGYKFKGSKLYIDFFISIYDTFVDDRKIFKKGSFFAAIARYFDKRTLENADEIIVDTNTHGLYFSQEFAISLNKMRTLYLEADTSVYYPRKIAKEQRFKNHFLVLFFGSILPVQGVDVILEASKILKNEEDIHFLIIGPISNNVRQNKFDNITYINWVNQEKLAKYIAQADLCLAGHFNKDIGKAHRTIPGKAYIYKAMGKRVIFGESNANKELFSENDDNIFVPMGNAVELADAIRREFRG